MIKQGPLGARVVRTGLVFSGGLLVLFGGCADVRPESGPARESETNVQRVGVDTETARATSHTAADPYRRQVEQARALCESGDWTQALEVAGSVVQAQPSHAGALAVQYDVARAREDFLVGHADPAADLQVACLHSPGQTYALYAPPGCPVRQAPILYVFSPSGNGRQMIEWFVQDAVRLGWLVAASNNSRNGPWDAIFEAQDAVFRDVAERLDLHPDMRFATGFSGGARTALALAFRYPGRISGVLAMGAGWPVHTDLTPATNRLNVYILIGSEDSNIKGDIPRTEKKLLGAGVNCVTQVYPGGHVRPPQEAVRAGCDWLDRCARSSRDDRAPQGEDTGALR